jgi:mitochondrial fission protein ELM1
MYKSLLFFLLSFVSIFASTPDIIIGIYNDGAIGDKNQIIGVVNTLKAHNSSLEFVEIPCTKDMLTIDVARQIKENDHSKKYIIIGVGNVAISVFEQLAVESLGHLKTLTLGHQWTETYSSLVDKVTWIALPSYATSYSLPKSLQAKLILTNGVSHAVTGDTLQTEYNAHQDMFPLTRNDCVVILGGDAPNKYGKVKRFTKKDAQKLARVISKKGYSGNFYILNGPRTGKHDSSLKEIPTAHRDGIVDRVTSTFSATLKYQQQGETEIGDSRVRVYDFQFGQATNPYLPLLGAAVNANVDVWVPGESSSMICEVISVLAPNNLIIYGNHAMNETHKKHVDSVYRQGRAIHYSKGRTKPLATDNVVVLQDARDQIAQIIIEANIH